MPTPLRSLQADFAAALFAAGAPVPAHLTSHTGVRPKRRFDVYRNNVFASLIGLLDARYPVTSRIVGADYFRAMARVHVERDPPRSPVLLLWGASFPSFLEGFEPVADLPYLPDVARLEWARQAAYHAADATPLDAGALAAIAPGDSAGLVLTPHPSLSVVASRHPVVTIWEANNGAHEPGPIDMGVAEAALVVRPHLDVTVVRIPEGAAEFVGALCAGRTLGEAYEAALAAAPGFDLAVNLGGLIRHGAFAAAGSGTR